MPTPAVTRARPRARTVAAGMVGRSLGALCAALPEGAARRLGRWTGQTAYRLRLRREIVEAQIAASFPDRPVPWVSATSAACYRHFGEELGVTFRLAHRGRAQLLARVRNPDEFPLLYRQVVPSGSGAVVVTGHLGNWELAGAYLAALGLPVTAVVQRQSGPFDRQARRLRASLGIETAYLGEHPRKLRRALADGGVVALVADQHAPEGPELPFLGRPARTHRGPARLAVALGVPIFFGALVRQGAGYRALFDRLSPSEASDDAVLELTGRWLARLEAAVRDDPGQYYWFHRRWRTEVAGTAERPGGNRARRSSSP